MSATLFKGFNPRLAIRARLDKIASQFEFSKVFIPHLALRARLDKIASQFCLWYDLA
jgi:hypothetical protein